MKTLIVEDDFTCRFLLQELLKPYGTSYIAVNGNDAVAICKEAIKNRDMYDLICLDIMMPEMDGHTALKTIRKLEDDANIKYAHRAKIVMTTALDDVKSVMGAFYELCDGYLVKPFSRENLQAELKRLHLI